MEENFQTRNYDYAKIHSFLFEKTIPSVQRFSVTNKSACLFGERQRNDLKSSSSEIGAVVESAASHNSTLSTKLYTKLSINKYQIAKTQKRTAQVAQTPNGIAKTSKKQIHMAKAQHAGQKYKTHKTRKNKLLSRGGVEDTRLEAKAKDTKKIRGQGQGQQFRGQTLSRPRTGMLEAKAKDTSASALQKKKKGLHKNFSGDLKKKKKSLHKYFSSDPHENTFSKKFFKFKK